MLLQLTPTVSPGQALTAKPGQTPKSRTKGRGPLRLGKTWRTASTPTPNRFHGHAPFQPRRANKPATRALRKNEREGRAERRPQCRALPGCHLPSPPRLPGASGAAAEPPPRASSPSRCHAALQQGKAGSPASLETPTPSEKPAGETDGELLGCEGTRLRNGGAEGRLPSNRPGGCGTRAAAWQTAQRSAAQGERRRRRPRAAETCPWKPAPGRLFFPEGKLPLPASAGPNHTGEAGGGRKRAG